MINKGNSIRMGNMLRDVPESSQGEIFEDIFEKPGIRVERIVSTGQSSPPDFWYDQGWDEWVLVVQGRAILELDGHKDDVELNQGDYLSIPAHKKHRVKWTDPTKQTIWLAIHYNSASFKE